MHVHADTKSGPAITASPGRRIERWLKHIRRDVPPAIILGGSVNGLSFVRSLGRRGIPTLLLDSDYLIGMYTRFGQVGVLADPEEDPDAWLDLFEFIGSRLESAGVIFATSDVAALFLAGYAETLGKSFRFITADLEAVEKIVNKRHQYAIAEKAGIPIPRTFFPESVDDVRRVIDDVPYPCILKSYKSHLGKKKIRKKVMVATSPDELVDYFGTIATGEVQFMIQEIIPGDDNSLYGYLAFWDKHAREHAWVTKQKLRQFPPLYGDGSFQQTVESRETRALSCKLLQQFNYRGFVGVEYKYDYRDQTYRLMEINPRTVSGNQLPISAGVDFPWIGYNYLLGREENQRGTRFRTGVTYMNEEWDFKAFLALRSAGKLTFGDWWRSLRRAGARAVGALDDPRPLLVVLLRFARAFLRGSRVEG
jgi:D-aspartate ligase